MDQHLDLDAYLARIGYEGPREPTLETLKAVHRLHPAAIPFENLDPLLGLPPRLDLASLQSKLVAGGRGGYCYEQNGLLKAALDAMGFRVAALAARVLWGVTADGPPRPRSHMLLEVRLDERAYIADVGFGGVVMTAPLDLHGDGAQSTPHEPFRLTLRPDDRLLEAELDGQWRPLYAFTLEPQAPADYEVMNWFTATHPASPFTFGLMAARATAEGRVALADNRLTLRPKGHAPQQHVLTTVDELQAALETHFGIVAPPSIGQLSGRIGLA